jgi:hypothetical protein
VPDDSTTFLSEAQATLLADVLDSIVPGGDGLPGAGELGVASHLDGVVSGSTRLRRVFTEGLAAIEIVSSRLFTRAFSDLSEDQRVQVLKRIESEHAAFFRELVRQTYAGYYTRQDVAALLGLEARPPQPLGYILEPFDPSTLENVKGRGKIYREI